MAKQRMKIKEDLPIPNSLAILESISDSVFVLDDSWNFLYLNQPAAKQFGVSIKKVISKKITLVRPEFKETVLFQKYKNALKSQKTDLFEYFSNEMGLWFEVRLYPFKNGVTIISKDISERKRTEDVLKLSENHYRTLVENAPDGTALLTPDGKYIDVTPAYCKIVGYSEDELLKMNWQEITYKDDLLECLTIAGQLVTGKIPTFQIQKRYVHKYGTPVWVQVNASLVKNDQGQPIVITQIQDITNLKKMESNLQETEQKYQLIQKVTKDLVFDWDLINDQNTVNENVKEIFGYELDYFCSQVPFSKWWSERIHPEDRDRIKHQREEIFATRSTVYQIEYRLLRADARYAFVRTNGYVYYDEGKAVRILGTTRDVTKEKIAELSVKQSEEKYSLVVNNVSDLISIVDPDANYLFVSPSHKIIMGYEDRDLIGINAFSLVHPDDLPTAIFQRERAMKGEEGYATLRIRHKDGHYITIDIKGKIIFDIFNKPYVIVLTSHDISERTELQNKRNLFVSTASHELKTPLTTLKGYVQILQKNGVDQERAAKHLGSINTQIDRLTALVNLLADSTLMEENKIRFDMKQFKLNGLVNEIVKSLKPLSNGHAIKVQAQMPIEIFADRDRLGQVLTNLITNAIKFSPKSDNVIVSLEQDSIIARIKVQDFGIGIASDDLKKIFTPFYQASNGNVQSQIGFGLGLHLAAEIIKKHKGTIDVESQLGRGSIFTVNIPLTKKLLQV